MVFSWFAVYVLANNSDIQNSLDIRDNKAITLGSKNHT